MRSYRGYWIVCRNCKFPIRLPDTHAAFSGATRRPVRQILLACPVCANVHSYRAKSLETVQFCTPDPFRKGSATIYLAIFCCPVGSCRSKATVRAVAASTVSVARLLEVWKFWKMHVRCKTGHVLHVPNILTWVVIEQRRVPIG